jgi:hypothetical protein
MPSRIPDHSVVSAALPAIYAAFVMPDHESGSLRSLQRGTKPNKKGRREKFTAGESQLQMLESNSPPLLGIRSPTCSLGFLS